MRFYGGSTAYYGTAQAVSFFQGGALSALVPDTYMCSVDGRPYMIDLSQPFYRQYHRQLAPLIRTQADTSKLPGEQTLDPNGLWRRSFEDWSAGAGQRYLDRDTSIDNGFFSSKGIDCLTNKWQIGLLPDTTSQRSSANTNLACVAADGFIYISDGNSVLYTNSLTGSVTWTAVTGTPVHPCSSLATDGFTVYMAFGASGVYTTTAGSVAAATQYVTSAIGSTAVLGYCNGRLMLGNNGSGGDGKLYNIIASGALPTALLAPGNPNATWVGFAEGNNFLYSGVQIGNNSLIYGCQVNSDGTALSPPSVQGKLPLGEGITALYGYEGQLFVGSTLGVRYASTSSSGINLGSVISGVSGVGLYGPTQSVQCFNGFGPFVYFGWSNYDGVSTGLGRVDLRTFVIQQDLPAFASDLMATTQGAVTGIANLGGVNIFAVSGVGFYVQSANLVASGVIQSGYVLYDIVDNKIASLLDLQSVGALMFGSYSAAVAVDGGAFVPVGLHTVGSPEPVRFGLPGMAGERFEVQLTLNRDSVSTTKGPLLTRWTLRSYPAPQRPINWQLPLIINESVTNRSGSSQGFDPLVELQALEAMAASGQPVVYQEANLSYQVFVQDVEFLPDYLTVDSHYYNGIALVTLEQLIVTD